MHQCKDITNQYKKRWYVILFDEITLMPFHYRLKALSHIYNELVLTEAENHVEYPLMNFSDSLVHFFYVERFFHQFSLKYFNKFSSNFHWQQQKKNNFENVGFFNWKYLIIECIPKTRNELERTMQLMAAIQC